MMCSTRSRPIPSRRSPRKSRRSPPSTRSSSTTASPSAPPAEDDMTDGPLFYTGLVAEAYAPLRSSRSDPAVYERFVRRCGEPALELACGHGEPILDLVAAGLDVTGLDISPDMIHRARALATARGLTAEFVCAPMQDFALGRTFRSIYIAGPSFQLILDLDDARDALRM